MEILVVGILFVADLKLIIWVVEEIVVWVFGLLASNNLAVKVDLGNTSVVIPGKPCVVPSVRNDNSTNDTTWDHILSRVASSVILIPSQLKI
jgi:hypothetical protein